MFQNVPSMQHLLHTTEASMWEKKKPLWNSMAACVISMPACLQACTPAPTHHMDHFQSSLCEALLRGMQRWTEYKSRCWERKKETRQGKLEHWRQSVQPAESGTESLWEWGQRRVGSQLAGVGWGWRMPRVLQTPLPPHEWNEEFAWKWGHYAVFWRISVGQDGGNNGVEVAQAEKSACAKAGRRLFTAS